MRIEEAARLLGVPASEVANVDDGPDGTVITSGGVRYLVRTEPDGAGRTGLMFERPPDPGRAYAFPVFTPVDEPAADAEAEPDGETPSTSVELDAILAAVEVHLGAAEPVGWESESDSGTVVVRHDGALHTVVYRYDDVGVVDLHVEPLPIPEPAGTVREALEQVGDDVVAAAAALAAEAASSRPRQGVTGPLETLLAASLTPEEG